MKLPSPLLDNQRGLSLVELMVALTIGLILSVGLLLMLSNTSRAFKVQDDFARLQENGTAALRYLVDDLRMAGFYGLTGTVSFSPEGGVTSIDPDCGSGSPPWALNVLQPIDVKTGLTPSAANTAFGCIQAADFAPNSPVIVLRGGTGSEVKPANLSANTLYVQSEASRSVDNIIIFAGGDFASLKAAGKTRFTKDTVDAPIFEYQAHVYYIRPCSRPTPPATTCGAGDDGGRQIPTLVRQELAGAAMQLVPLVEGIEAVNLVFGLDTDGNGVADKFTPTPPANWDQVMSVRVSVLARTTSGTMGFSDVGNTYDLGGGLVIGCAPGPDCSLRRHVFSQVVSVRNSAVRNGAAL